MSSVTPVTIDDLNGIALSPQDLCTDELVGYVGYVKNLCSDLGTKNDSPEGFQDWINFQKEIDSAYISTFTPDSIDDNHTFDSLDLTGEKLEIKNLPIDLFAMWNNQLMFCYAMNNGFGVTPFDVGSNEMYAPFDATNPGLTPFDVNGAIPAAVKKDELELTA